MSSSNVLPASASVPPTALILRLTLGSTMLLGAILFFLGTSWDIQWHTFIGRDRTLIPPHILMLTGVTISGVAALASVVSETSLARRIPTLAALPPATDSLVMSEHLLYRRGGLGELAVVALKWPLAPIIAAFVLDRVDITAQQR